MQNNIRWHIPHSVFSVERLYVNSVWGAYPRDDIQHHITVIAMHQYNLRTAYRQPVTNDDGEPTGEHTRIAEIDCWQVYDDPAEIPDDHPGQHVVSRNGKHWLEPKRILMLRLDDLDRDYKHCCTGARISGHNLLDQPTTVYEEKDVEYTEDQPVTETATRYEDEWSEAKGRYVRVQKEYQRPVYDEYEIEDENGKVIDAKRVQRTQKVTRTEREKVARETTLRDAIEAELGEAI